MKTKAGDTKTFDAVVFMRKRGDEISKEIEGMTPTQEMEYFKRKSKELRTRKKK